MWEVLLRKTLLVCDKLKQSSLNFTSVKQEQYLALLQIFKCSSHKPGLSPSNTHTQLFDPSD